MWLLSSLLLWWLCGCYCCSVAKLCSTLWTPWTEACQAPLSSTISQSLLKFMSVKWVMLSNRGILCHPLLLLPSVFLSIIVFSNDSALSIRWPEYRSFGISSSSEYSGFIPFRIDWFDLLAVLISSTALVASHTF